MTHPVDEVLSAYVDGDLPEADRAAVAAHLDACPSCREDVALAARARDLLRALPEEPVPVGVTGGVLREVLGPGRGQRRARALRWLSGAAAAAAVVAAFALALPELGDGGAPPVPRDAAALREAGPPGVPEAQALPSLERSDRDFRPEDLQALARGGAAGTGGTDVGGAEAPRAAARALDCVLRGSDLAPDDVVVRLVQARFQGTPAYLAVALRGPGAGQPATKVVVWVVAREGCEPLAYSQGTL